MPILYLAIAGVFLFPYAAIAEPAPPALSIPKIPTINQQVRCSCVKYVRSLGAKIPYGTDASDFIPNSPPVVGGVAMFRYPSDAHVAFITAITEDGFYITESNYHTCKLSSRFVEWTDPAITGFWYN